MGNNQNNYTQKDAKEMFSNIANGYDLNNTLLSFGIHFLWKKKLVKELISRIHPDGQIIDLCTGTGDILNYIDSNMNAIGIDFCQEMLEIAEKKLKGKHKLMLGDALSLDIQENFADAVSIAFGVRNFSDLNQGLSEIHRITKENGYVFILEFGQPTNRLFRKIYNFYSNYLLPYIAYLISKDKEAYKYLVETSRTFPSNTDFKDILLKSHFKNVSIIPLNLGIAYLYIMQPDKSQI